MVVGVLVAKKYLSYTTPKFESTAKLRLADAGEGVPNSNLFKDLDVFATSNKIAAEIEVLKSQVLLSKVLTNLNFEVEINRVGKLKTVELFEKTPIQIDYSGLNPRAFDQKFDLELSNSTDFVITDPETKVKYTGKLGAPVQTNYGPLVISANDSILQQQPDMKVQDHYTFQICSIDKMITNVLKDLDVMAVDKDVAVVRISYKSTNPVKAAKLVNKLAETYIQDYIESKYKAANVTVNFLDDQINQVIGKLTNSENAIQNYRDRKGITNITQETETDLRKISQLKIQQTNVKMNLDALRDLDGYVQKGKSNFLELAPNFEAFNDLLSTEIIKKTKALQAEKRDLLMTYTKEDARVKVVDDKITDLSSYLTESIGNSRKNVESKYANLSNDIVEAEKVFIGVPEKEKMLTILNREFQIYQSSYNFLNEKKIEAEIAKAAKIAFHRVLTPAVVAKEPVSPNRTIITIVSALLAMFSALLLIFLVHTLKAKVNDLKTVESNSRIPVALLTPRHQQPQAIQKTFNDTAIQLELKGLMRPHEVLCFSSYTEREGAKFNVLNLAAALARQGRKVMVVGADEQLVGCPDLNGAAYESLLLNDHSFTRYTKAMMREVLDELKASYEVVLILNEPLHHSSKSNLFMSLADLNLIVVDARLTPVKRILETEILKGEYKIPQVFFLINRYGYNPTVFAEITAFFRRIRKGTKRKTHAI